MKKGYLLICFMFIFLFNIGYSLGMSPLYFDERVDMKGGYKEFVFENKTLNRVRYKIMINKSKGPYDVSKWVTVYPKVLTIDPMAVGIVKVFVKAPKNTPQGEYNFKLYSKPLVLPTMSKSKGNLNARVSTVTSLEVELSSYVGDPILDENIQGVDIKLSESKGDLILNGLLKNNSFKRFHFGIKTLDSSGKTIDSEEISSIAKHSSYKLQNVRITSSRRASKIAIYDLSTKENILVLNIRD